MANCAYGGNILHFLVFFFLMHCNQVMMLETLDFHRGLNTRFLSLFLSFSLESLVSSVYVPLFLWRNWKVFPFLLAKKKISSKGTWSGSFSSLSLSSWNDHVYLRVLDPVPPGSLLKTDFSVPPPPPQRGQGSGNKQFNFSKPCGAFCLWCFSVV